MNSKRTKMHSLQRVILLMIPIGALPLLQKDILAMTGSSITIPQSPTGKKIYSNKNGLRLTLDTTWVGDEGYRPIEVTIESANVTATELLIDFKFTALQSRRTKKATSTEKSYSIPIGTSSHSTTLLVPQFHTWDLISCEVWVDGVPWIEGAKVGGNANVFPFTPQSSDLSVMVLGEVSQQNQIKRMLQGIPNLSMDVLSSELEGIPSNFLSFTGLDVIALPADGLLKLKNKDVVNFNALMDWVHAGGNLWLFDAGLSYAMLGDINQAIADLSDSKKELELDDWRYLPFSKNKISSVDALVQMKEVRIDRPVLSPSEVDWAVRNAKDSRSTFLALAYGFGAVVAIQSSDFPLQKQSLAVIEQTAISNRLEAIERLGNSPKASNYQFNNWLIPDVGMAPVFEFQFLISIFVILIGPVNYWLLKRSNHLPLLLVTVPASALLTTILLFVYGFASDGFSTRVRARSLTILDQETGKASSWSRLSYYAGIAPKEGLVFPETTAVFPIPPSRGRSGLSSRDHYEKELVWDEGQHLSRGWLSSRTPTQYLTISSKSLSHQILFYSQPNKLIAENALGTEIQLLVIKNKDGKVYFGKNIQIDSKAALKPGNLKTAQKDLREIFLDNELEFPIGFVDQSRSSRNSLSSNSLSNNLMEAHLSMFISPVADCWKNGSYIAVTKKGVSISLGMEDITESDSLHVIQGTW